MIENKIKKKTNEACIRKKRDLDHTFFCGMKILLYMVMVKVCPYTAFLLIQCLLHEKGDKSHENQHVKKQNSQSHGERRKS